MAHVAALLQRGRVAGLADDDYDVSGARGRALPRAHDRARNVGGWLPRDCGWKVCDGRLYGLTRVRGSVLVGARLGTEDNDTTGRFMGQDFDTTEATATPETANAELDALIGAGVQFVVTLADDATTLALADAAREGGLQF